MKRARKITLFKFSYFGFCVLALYAIALLLPLIWAFICSFKSFEEYNIFENVLGLPLKVDLASLIQNYKTALTYGYASAVEEGQMIYYGIPMQLVHSLLYAGGCTVASTLVHSVTAYVVARYDYKFSKVVYSIVIVTMILPVFGSMQSNLMLMKSIGLFDTFLGAWYMQAHFLTSAFLIYYAQFKQIPKDYTEAARIDGASHFYTMTKVIMPLAKGTIGTLAIVNFVTYWNDYMTPMVYLPSKPVLAVGMFQFGVRMGAALASAPTKVAYMMLTSLPVLLFYILFNKKLMGNVSMGGIKG